MKRITLLVALLACALGGCTIAQRGGIDLAYRAYNKKDYATALRKLAEAEKFRETSPALKAEIAYLRAKSYEGLGNTAEAIGCYRYVATQFPDSQYAFMAKEKVKELEQRPPAPPAAQP